MQHVLADLVAHTPKDNQALRGSATGGRGIPVVVDFEAPIFAIARQGDPVAQRVPMAVLGQLDAVLGDGAGYDAVAGRPKPQAVR